MARWSIQNQYAGTNIEELLQKIDSVRGDKGALIDEFKQNIALEQSKGKWLDLWGKLLGIPRTIIFPPDVKGFCGQSLENWTFDDDKYRFFLSLKLNLKNVPSLNVKEVNLFLEKFEFLGLKIVVFFEESSKILYYMVLEVEGNQYAPPPDWLEFMINHYGICPTIAGYKAKVGSINYNAFRFRSDIENDLYTGGNFYMAQFLNLEERL